MEESALGCWREAQRADKVAAHLSLIRSNLANFSDHITGVLKEIERSSRLLRDLYDLFPIYKSRVPTIRYYLDVILPCFQWSLQHMMVYVDTETLPEKARWTLMCERLGAEGMTLAARFTMFVDFLIQVIRLLSRSNLYDSATLELLRLKILRLRAIQNIPAPPVPIKAAHHVPERPIETDLQRRHWAEKIFDDAPHSTTGLRHRRDSQCFGLPMPEVRLGVKSGSSVLFKLPFDKNRLSVTLYLQPGGPDMTRLLCRWMDRYHNPLYSCYGVHEICVRRKGSSLQFRRWSTNKAHPTLWMALFFKTWEKMVLFHSAFGALKSRNPLTVDVLPEEVCLEGERRLFQGRIVDDGFDHLLFVLQDERSGGIRLHAAVRGGELKKCPVWTAFVTYQSASPDWMARRSRHRIWLRDIHPYVFCQKYRKKHQMKKNGEFEIYFVNEEAADTFEDVFLEAPEVSVIALRK